MLSTLGGLSAFATYTIPLVLLPRSRSGGRGSLLPALILTTLLGGGAFAITLLAAPTLVVSFFGAKYNGVAKVAPLYMLAMALLGISRVLVAHGCAGSGYRRVALLAGVAAVVQMVTILCFGHAVRSVALCTLTATAVLAASLTLATMIPWARAVRRT